MVARSGHPSDLQRYRPVGRVLPLLELQRIIVDGDTQPSGTRVCIMISSHALSAIALGGFQRWSMHLILEMSILQFAVAAISPTTP